MDRSEFLQHTSSGAVAQISEILGVAPTLEAINPYLVAAIGAEQASLYRLAQYLAKEMDSSRNNGNWFSACIMGAATNEALLTLTCLHEQKVVARTATYRGNAKPSKSFSAIVGEWNFNKLIKVSNDLGWIPPDVVTADLLGAVVEDFPKLAQTVYPNMKPDEVSNRCAALAVAPGPEMLKISQDIRNLVHPPRWIKEKCLLDEVEFTENCKLATLVSIEVAHCLMLRFANSFSTAHEKLAAFKSLPDQAKEFLRQHLLRR